MMVHKFFRRSQVPSGFTSGLLVISVLAGFAQPGSPMILSGVCKDRCEHERERNYQGAGAFEFTCDGDECAKHCESCPKEVCDETRLDIKEPWKWWRCPESEGYPGPCKLECDKARTRNSGKVRNVYFECNNLYRRDQSALDLCQDTCANHCPSHVCMDKKNMYRCPYADPDDMLGDKCRDLCHQKTKDAKATVRVDCRDSGESHPDSYPSMLDWCKDACQNCRNPQGINYYCELPAPGRYDMYFYCPKIPAPKPKTYKGRCKNRCEKSQGGGPQPYQLNCETAFGSSAEKLHCRDTCLYHCPDGWCIANQLTNEAIINCPGNKTRLAELEEEKRKDLEKWEEEKENFKSVHRSLRGSRDNIKVTAIVLGVLLALVIIGWIAHTCRLKSRSRKLSNQAQANFMQANAQATMMMMTAQPSGMPQAGGSQSGMISPAQQMGIQGVASGGDASSAMQQLG